MSGPLKSQQKAAAAVQTRAAILDAALREFAEEGYAGARTEHIARAANVNVALVFYYFRSKDKLYGAVLEQIFAEWSRAVTSQLQSEETPERKVFGYISAYFDYISQFPQRPRLVQQEMMRRGRTGSRHIRQLAEKYIRPVHRRLREVIQQGIREGSFHRLDPEHVGYSITGMINFYFASSPIITILSGRDPLSPAGIERRKKEVLKFLDYALTMKRSSKKR